MHHVTKKYLFLGGFFGLLVSLNTYYKLLDTVGKAIVKPAVNFIFQVIGQNFNSPFVYFILYTLVAILIGLGIGWVVGLIILQIKEKA